MKKHRGCIEGEAPKSKQPPFPEERESSCIWERDEFHDAWVTDCDNKFQFMHGGPEDNGFQYCPYCGKKIK